MSRPFRVCNIDDVARPIPTNTKHAKHELQCASTECETCRMCTLVRKHKFLKGTKYVFLCASTKVQNAHSGAQARNAKVTKCVLQCVSTECKTLEIHTPVRKHQSFKTHKILTPVRECKISKTCEIRTKPYLVLFCC